jgi:hypothetical protein
MYSIVRKSDDSIKRYSELYGSYLEEKRNLESINDKRVRRCIETKIED